LNRFQLKWRHRHRDGSKVTGAAISLL
jgi:hypothetical protein